MSIQISLNEIKKSEIKLLIEFRKFCDENNLRYSLGYGTLLGAIRHKGFIPWDDDIDVIMPRSDYEEFLKKFSTDKKNIRLISNRYNTMDAPFSKLVDTDIFVSSNTTDTNLEKYLWVDIFPIDGLPDNDEEISKKIHKVKFLLSTLSILYVKLKFHKKFKYYIKILLKPFVHMYGKEKIINKIEEIAREYSYETSNYVGMVVWSPFGIREKLPKQVYEDFTEVFFEGEKFKAVKNWDLYLKSKYGNYMKLPPKDKRVTHGITAYKNK